MGDRHTDAIDHINEKFVRLSFLNEAVNSNMDGHKLVLGVIHSNSSSSATGTAESKPARRRRYVAYK